MLVNVYLEFSIYLRLCYFVRHFSLGSRRSQTFFLILKQNFYFLLPLQFNSELFLGLLASSRRLLGREVFSGNCSFENETWFFVGFKGSAAVKKNCVIWESIKKVTPFGVTVFFQLKSFYLFIHLFFYIDNNVMVNFT